MPAVTTAGLALSATATTASFALIVTGVVLEPAVGVSPVVAVGVPADPATPRTPTVTADASVALRSEATTTPIAPPRAGEAGREEVVGRGLGAGGSGEMTAGRADGGVRGSKVGRRSVSSMPTGKPTTLRPL